MSELDVIEQLGTYGAWLQRATGLQITPVEHALGSADEVANESSVSGELRSPRPARPLRRRLVAAAAVLAIAGAGAVWVARGATSAAEVVVATAPDDPAGPLYVLPSVGSDHVVVSGRVGIVDVPARTRPDEVLVAGRPTEGGHEDLVFVTLGGQPLESRSDWSPIDVPGGPVQVSEKFGTTVVQERPEGWLTIQGGDGQLEQLVALTAATSVGDDGRLILDPSSGHDVLDARSIPDLDTSTYTSFEIPQADDLESIIVETATGVTPLMGVGVLQGELTAAEIGGLPGWQLSRSGSEGDWNGVAWQATPTRTVAVSGNVAMAEIMAIAEELEIVDEATWESALPGFIAED